MWMGADLGQSTGLLILTPAVVRSGWPPQNDLRLSIFTPCTAGDYNGAFFPPSALPLAVSLHSGSHDITGQPMC